MADDLRSPLGQAAAPSAAADDEPDENTFAHKLAIGHQEIDRIVDEAEQIYNMQPTEWLPLAPIGQMMLHEMYEDVDELEDALGGSFEEFMKILPQFEVRTSPESVVEYKVRPVDPDAPPTLMTLRVACRRDLWRVLYKSPDACIRFPALEFEIGADSKRRIDSVYNHITSAVWNLSSHLRGSANAGGEAASGADAITDLCEKLNEMLDVEEPFEIVVDDPTGASIFKPDDGIDVVTL